MVKRALRRNAVLLILVALVVILSILSPSFRTNRNLLNILRKISTLGIVTCGLTFPLVAGGLDLSVGSTFSLIGVLCIMLQPSGLTIAIGAPILVACLIGLTNGFIVNRFNVNPIIVTLGMLSVIQGLTLVITNSKNQLGRSDGPFSLIANGKVLGINNQIIIFIGVALIMYLLLHRTTFGRYVFLMGSNPEAAKIAGLKVGGALSMVYIICSATAGLSAIVLSSRLSGAQPYAGQGLEFEAITAVLIGGNSIGGGRGSIYQTVLGVLLVSVLINGMILLNLPFPLQTMMKGLLIIVAVISDVRSRAREQGA